MGFILQPIGIALLHMLSALATETFIKKAAILLLEKVSAKTASDLDDKLLAAAKEAWGEPK